jgi:hypothetical protein
MLIAWGHSRGQECSRSLVRRCHGRSRSLRCIVWHRPLWRLVAERTDSSTDGWMQARYENARLGRLTAKPETSMQWQRMLPGKNNGGYVLSWFFSRSHNNNPDSKQDESGRRLLKQRKFVAISLMALFFQRGARLRGPRAYSRPKLWCDLMFSRTPKPIAANSDGMPMPSQSRMVN